MPKTKTSIDHIHPKQNTVRCVDRAWKLECRMEIIRELCDVHVDRGIDDKKMIAVLLAVIALIDECPEYKGDF